jgi:small subunit ribosomal protein S20
MANTKSAKKAFKQSEKRRAINKSRKSMVKTSINSCLQLLKENSNEKEFVLVLFKKAQEQIQRAASKGCMHKNTASRKVSNLAKKVNLHLNKLLL